MAKRASVVAMSEAADEDLEAQEELAPPRRRRRGRYLLLAVLLIGLTLAWAARERIANRIIAGQLDGRGIRADYTIEKVGVSQQVLTNVLIGDPGRPDMTIEKVVIDIVPTFGLPTVGKVVLVRPRLYGTYKDARASFGALDKLIFAKSERPAGLPDMELELIDGRARLDSDFGPVGIKAEGSGNLRNGFAGTLAGLAPGLEGGGCKGDAATLYGKLTSADARLGFSGPLRLKALTCGQQDLTLKDAVVQLDLRAGAEFDALDGTFALTTGALGWQGVRLSKSGGKGDFAFRNGDLTTRFALEATALGAGWADAARLSAQGFARSRDRLARFEGDGTVAAEGVRVGTRLDGTLAGLARSGKGTLLAPLAGQLRKVLASEARNARFGASYVLRGDGATTSITIPRAALRGASGADLLALSRVGLTLAGEGGPRLAGDIRTGGAGLPEIAGRFVRRGAGGEARLSMREFRAGTSRIALPSLRLVQERGGAVGFAGRATLSGDLPGGWVENLVLPIDGNWSGRSGLAMWRRCSPVRFDRLAIANLSLESRSLKLCPGKGAILRSDGRGTILAAGTSALNLAGKLGDTPIRLASGAVGLSWPGRLVARDIAVELGGAGEASAFKLAELEATLANRIAGRFAGTEARLGAVPLDVLEAQGAWSLAGGELTLSQATFTLEDREPDARFYPLVARDASLRLKDGRISAEALLREPRSDREIVRTRIVHDLGNGAGHADLEVPGIVFDQKLQPDTLSYYPQGVVALAKGEVGGQGRIDWTPAGVISSGSFQTDGLDFAAAFGPVKGVSGTVEFTDLLGLVTAPDQRLKIASINPGIEVAGGDVSFQLQPDRVLAVNGAHWPFIDGTLELLPTRMVLGAAEVRRYTLRVKGANAAKFVAQLELGNLAATGVFDGELPLVFDENGGHIEGGMLVSRPPGGNVSYVGELTYKDMGRIANFAFESLRSIDYRRMEIGMDGLLEGEIVTRVRFDGVRQGASAKRSIVSRGLASLPIQFNVNIRAPFQKLLGSFKSLYDPAYIRDPRTLGLIGKDGKPPPGPELSSPPSTQDSNISNAIQPPDSRNRP